LKALVVGGFVRGLSMRDVESLCDEAGLGRTSKSTVATICAELHERFEAFCRRSLYDVNLVVLFLDAIYLPVRPSGPKEGVICAWGITETGSRELVSVRLGTSTASNTSKPTQTPSTRRSQPHRLNPGNPNRARIYSGKWTPPDRAPRTS
jgi:transposase-like protein